MHDLRSRFTVWLHRAYATPWSALGLLWTSEQFVRARLAGRQRWCLNGQSSPNVFEIAYENLDSLCASLCQRDRKRPLRTIRRVISCRRCHRAKLHLHLTGIFRCKPFQELPIRTGVWVYVILNLNRIAQCVTDPVEPLRPKKVRGNAPNAIRWLLASFDRSKSSE